MENTAPQILAKNFLAVAMVASLAGCAQLTPFTPKNEAQNKAPANKQREGSGLSGSWMLAFAVSGQTVKAQMHLVQANNQLTGDVVEEASGQEYSISQGQVSGSHVSFNLTNGQQASQPLQFTGHVEIVHDKDYQGPWMHGDFQAPAAGVQGNWEAQQTQAAPEPGLLGAPEGAGADNSGSLLQAPEGASQAPGGMTNHAPQLSGWWNAGYEYDFKTIRSRMFLEQDNGKLSGHGEDLNTKERFTIEKGWYSFPHMTIIRTYRKGKGAAKDRTLTFKADVKMVNAPDYQGPYLKGKTQGGGNWEAQLVR